MTKGLRVNCFTIPNDLLPNASLLNQLAQNKGLIAFASDERAHVTLFEKADQALTSQLIPFSAQDIDNGPIATGSRLVVLAEALSVAKLKAIRSGLPAGLRPHCFDMQISATGFGVVAKAELGDGHIPAALLNQLSNQYMVELAVIKDAPTLSKPGLVLFDMDSTLIQMECIDEIAKLADVGDKVSQVTELAMQGKLDFSQSLLERVACLEGVPVALLQSIRDRIPLMPGVSKLIWTLQQNGWKVALASGGFTFFADYVKQRLGLDYAISNVLEQNNGLLTGKVVGDIVDAQVKANTVAKLAKQYGIPAAQTLAVGDGANDLKMMGAAALGIAFHAKPIVVEQAGAAVHFAGLDCILDYLS